MERTKAVLSSLFPVCAVAVAVDPDGVEGSLFPEEQEQIRKSVAKRRREFRGGRLAAREALRRLGLSEQPIPVGADRAPIWPEAVVGSISHSGDFCAAVVARCADLAGLGLDVERDTPLNEGLFRRVCTQDELARWVEPDPDPGRRAKMFFSAKESVYKCLYPSVRRVLSFQEVSLRFTDNDGRYVIDLSALPGWEDRSGELKGRCLNHDGHWFCGTTLLRRPAD